MNRFAVINVVGLTTRLIGDQTPFIKRWLQANHLQTVKPVVPAVTCTAQSTYLTGKWPDKHGVVGNGWYFKEECEVKFWRQSNKLVQAPKIWEVARKLDSNFTCANMFWWYNMQSSVDYSVTPRPNYLADGRKIPDIYTMPAALRDSLQTKLGQFPLFNFWGPNTSVKSSNWIADAAIEVDKQHSPTLNLIYLPHLDYNLQRHGLDFEKINKDLNEIDEVVKRLVVYFEKKGIQVVLLSEYGITDVNNPIHLNRTLRKGGYLAIREERGLELLDAGASQAFAIADHQVAHIHVKNKAEINNVRSIVRQLEGVEQVLDANEMSSLNMVHERSGDLLVIANKNSWFTYYYWLDEKKAPDFARIVDIHNKPGYDPVEMLLDPKIKFPLLTIGLKLLKKKLGFRTLLDVIPTDASLIKGSHGRVPENDADWPIFANNMMKFDHQTIEAVAVFDQLLSLLTNSKEQEALN